MDQQSVKSNDSYEDRRKLFKNIWDAAIEMDDKDKDYVNVPPNKPKVIKTLRLNETDGINIGKNKRQRIKNLRTVCTRLLDICDKQEADLLYDQISAARQDSSVSSIMFTHRRKIKKGLRKKRVNQSKKAEKPQPIDILEETASIDIDTTTDGPVTHRGTKPLRDIYSPRIERAALIKQFLNQRYNLQKAMPDIDPVETKQKLDLGDAPHKVVKKENNRRKSSNARKSSNTSSPTRCLASTSTRVPAKVKKKTNAKDDIPDSFAGTS